MEGAEAGWGVVLFEIVAAGFAVDVGDLYAAEATAADRGHLKLALRAEVEGGVDFCGAMRAARQNGLAQQEVDDGADAAGHQHDDQHPNHGWHVASLDVAADVADQKHVAGEERAPGVTHEQTHGEHFRLVVRQDAVHDVLHAGEDQQREQHGPPGNQLQIAVRSAAAGAVFLHPVHRAPSSVSMSMRLREPVR